MKRNALYNKIIHCYNTDKEGGTMLSTKDLDVLTYLTDHPEGVFIKELADHFALSERSIRYYLHNIQLELPHGITIVKGCCYLLDCPAAQAFLNHPIATQYSSEIKKKIMYYHLVFDGFINITAMSNQLAISRSSGKAYLEEIKQQLLSYHIELQQVHKKGLVLAGSEENIRKLQLQVCLDYDKLSDTFKKILLPIMQQYRQALPEQKVHDFLHILQKESNTMLSDHSYALLFYSCLILLQRNAHGHPLQSCENEYFLVTCAEYELIVKYQELLSPKLNHYELLQLTSILIGSTYAKTNNILENNWFEHDLLVSKIITLFSNYYHLNLNQDRTLYESLLTHLRPTMYRLLNNIPVSDMNYKEIKQQFPKEYAVMKQVLQELNFFTGEHQDQDETALLTLHFKAAINRWEAHNQVKKNVLIICSHGYGTSKLLEQQLLDTYEVNVLDCIPYHYLTQYERIEEVDFLITTIASLKEYQKLPILHVKPILGKEELSMLDHSLLVKRKNKVSMSLVVDTIKKSCTIHELATLKQDLQDIFQTTLLRDDTKDQTLLDILPIENILLHYHAADWREAIAAAGNLLVNNGYVQAQYKQQMLYSFENYGSYMIIEDGIAIPHAKNEGTVMKTGMTLVILDEPVTFLNGKQLQVFFSFCSKDNIEHLDALVAVATLIKETQFQQLAARFQKSEDVIQYILLHNTSTIC